MRCRDLEKLLGLIFVLVLHGAALYELWSYRIIPTPDEAITLMVNLINPPPPEQARAPEPEPPKPPKPHPPDPPPEPQQLVTEAPVVLADEPDIYVPPSPPPAVEAPPLPPLPVVLSRELSVSCPERSPPDYPPISVRMNEQGRVVLRVVLGEDGRVANIEVKTSSGYRRLDDAAMHAVRTWQCEPSVRNGVTVRAVAMQPFNFTLAGE